MRHLEDRAPAWALGLALGLAVSTKYTAAALAVPVLAAVWLRRARAGRREPTGRPGSLAGLVALAASASRSPAGRALPSRRASASPTCGCFTPSRRGPSCRASRARASPAGRRCWACWPFAPGPARRASRASVVRREVVVAGLAAAAGFVLGTPGAVLEPRAFLSDLAFNAQTRHEYKGLVGEATSFGAYLGLAADALTLARARGGGRRASRSPSRRAWRGGRRRRSSSRSPPLAPYLLVASSGHRAMRFLAAGPAGRRLARRARPGQPSPPSARGAC